MTKHYKLTLAAFALFLSALMPIAAKAQTAPSFARPPAPKVAFVGDWLTDSWSATFPANWIDVDTPGGFANSQTMAAAIALKPSLIHIMIGSEYTDDDASYNLATAELEEGLVSAITQVQAAGIPVIVGLEPLQCTSSFAVQQMDLIAYAVATKYGVPIINYSGAFSNAQTGWNGVAYGFASPGDYGTGVDIAQAFAGDTVQFFTPTDTPTSINIYSVNQPTAAGYAIMTMMAQTAFATLNAQPKSLYLQDLLTAGNEGDGQWGTIPNVNTVSPGNVVNFYTVISYTNGVTGVGFNTNFLTGTNGTWTSSNPLAGIVNQYGQFWAINQGTTTVKFTLPNGVWNEWIMYVGPTIEG
jgi:hypothetical protein